MKCQPLLADLGILAGNWQSTGAYWYHGDFNYDGEVNLADLGILAGNWQQGVGGGPTVSFDEAVAMFDAFDGVVVPEPGAAAVLGMAGVLVMRRRVGGRGRDLGILAANWGKELDLGRGW